MYTYEDYEEVKSNQEVHVVVFQEVKGSTEYYVRLWIDYDTHDHLLTFGPMDASDVDRMLPILRGSYCHITENWDGPIYERDKKHESEAALAKYQKE